MSTVCVLVRSGLWAAAASAASPPCSLEVKYRSADGNPILGGLTAHGYLKFTSPAGVSIFEGGIDFADRTVTGSQDKLTGASTPGGLSGANPTDQSLGKISGAFVCDWIVSLWASVDRITAAKLTYREIAGPNSNSALRYILSQLPKTIVPWFNIPFYALWGYSFALPGLG